MRFGPQAKAVHFSAAVCLALWMLVAWFAEPGLVYAKLQSDAAVYLAQARFLWEHGEAYSIVLGEGMKPIVYAPLQAFLRAPLFGLSQDPATVVRLVQVQNLLLMVALAILSYRYLAWRLPAGTHPTWRAAPWLYLVSTYNPWSLNLVFPLADHLYSLLTLGALWLGLHRPASEDRPRWRVLAVCGLVALGMVQKFTSLALLPALVISRGHRIIRWRWWAAMAALLALGLWIQRALLSTYATAALEHYLIDHDPVTVLLDSITNLVVAAIPSQVIPNFSYLFHRDFTATHAVLFSDLNAANAVVALLGATVTATVASGAWRSRHTMAPELALVLIVTPVYAVVLNSTGRYLASLQPIFIVWLAIALKYVWAWRPRLPIQMRWIAGLAALVILAMMGGNFARSVTSRGDARLFELQSFLQRLKGGFERGASRLQQLNQTQPEAHWLLQVDDIRWYPLAGIAYVSASQAALHVCAGQTVFAVFACDARNCPRLNRQLERERKASSLVAVQFETIYRDEADWGVFFIDRLVLRDAALCMPD